MAYKHLKTKLSMKNLLILFVGKLINVVFTDEINIIVLKFA